MAHGEEDAVLVCLILGKLEIKIKYITNILEKAIAKEHGEEDVVFVCLILGKK